MGDQQSFNPLAFTHLLQHTLRSLCIQENSQWVYAVFWRILPRNYPPPKWDFQGGMYDRTRGTRGNRRNWILAWEDGFCNFGASACEQAAGTSHDEVQVMKSLQPELFFKMSHEIYNYGEGIIGKVAADHSHKWVFKKPQEQEINLLSTWNNPADSYPRTWEAQFQSGGIKTIALIAVREGVIQLGSLNKVVEDLSYVALLRKKFAYIESIPGVFLPHPSSSGMPISVPSEHCWHSYTSAASLPPPPPPPPPSVELYDQHLSAHQQAMRITPSMNSLEALLAKLPSVGPSTPASSAHGYYEMPMAKEEINEEEYGSSSPMSYYVNVSKSNDQEF